MRTWKILAAAALFGACAGGSNLGDSSDGSDGNDGDDVGDQGDDGSDDVPANADAGITDPFTPDAGPGGPDPTLTIPEFYAQSAKAYCAKFFACCTPGEITEVFASAQPPVTDVASCELLLGGLNQFRAQEVEANVMGGKMAYDPGKAAMCVAKINGTACDAFAAVAAPWEVFEMTTCADLAPVKGTIANGGECTDYLSGGQSCASGYCEREELPGGNEKYTCKALPTLGQACPEWRCAAGSWCDGGTTCKAPKADGQPCDSGLECTSGACPGATQSTAGVCGEAQTCDGP